MYFSLETYAMVSMKGKKHIKEGDKNTAENTILMKTTWDNDEHYKRLNITITGMF